MATLEDAKKWVLDSDRIVGFSGAGISTESGIPDFRSPNGIWATNRTVYFQEFISSQDDRIEYWQQKKAMWPEMREAKPNKGHDFFVKLEKAKKLLGMITQNIERLHQKAGLPNDKVIELHGNTVDVTCLDCQTAISMDEACERIDKGELSPECTKCKGLLKPATISFGQSLNQSDLDRAVQLCEQSDLFIAVGSSLVVQPAANFPVLAKQNGARLIIVNRTETPLDGFADLVVHSEIGPTLEPLFS